MAEGMAPAYELRSRLRQRASSFRVRFCGCGTVAGDPSIVIQEFKSERRAHWRGVMLCQRQYACPVCGARRAAERAAELEAMMRADPDGRWQMLTLTLRHHAGERLADLIAELFAAYRRVRATRRVRDIFAARVRATARSLEVTHGENGWHPHLHVVMGTTEWTDEERRTLAEEWERALPNRTERHCALVWSNPVRGTEAARARYIAKLGGELAGIAKEPKGGNRTPWQIARASLRSERAAELWTEYQRAMKRRRVLELDRRAKVLARVGSETTEPLREWEVSLYREEYRALVACEATEPGVLWRVLEEARTTTGPDPPGALRVLLDVLIRGSPRVSWLAGARFAA